MVMCAASGCHNNSKTKAKKHGVTFHSFPQNPKLREQWIRAIRRKDWSPSVYSKLCSVHFKEQYLDRTSLSCVRVREHAVPSIFPSQPETDDIRYDPNEGIIVDQSLVKGEIDDEYLTTTALIPEIHLKVEEDSTKWLSPELN